ncbi:ribbon-helix-helix protein, CopG family [Desulfobacter vibrioformis]|uniref:ribbon-helix-helix protein, CopG family n=1 Tax=Desulfobacter vibrioformis TaxID=34031 RepID=UPI0005585D32|nr:ribbon-helix-helix protein, CopG family [Desulfobacter vibrioformis]
MKNKDLRVSVNLPENIVETLKQLAARDGITMTEVIRKAIMTEKLLSDELKEGNKILIEDQSKKFRQLIFR